MTVKRRRVRGRVLGDVGESAHEVIAVAAIDEVHALGYRVVVNAATNGRGRNAERRERGRR